MNHVMVALLVSMLPAAALAGEARDYPIQPVPFTAVEVRDGFWTPRMETNRTVTVWYDFAKCEETGRIDNFAKAGGLTKGEFRGIPYDDSDVYKVIEGAAYTLAKHPDPKLDKYLDELIAKIAAAQEPDGYLYTARRLLPPEKMPGMAGRTRWSHLAHSHELYNVGHLYEAAVAHFQATGKRTLLDVAIKNANLLVELFGPGKLTWPPGHEEIEIGLVKLYRQTGNPKYLELSRYYVDQRGRANNRTLYGKYAQDHAPLVEQDEPVGHAVRAGYFYAGAADVAAITGNADWAKALDRLWENVTYRKLYLTGGIGARGSGEAFGDDYELPNHTAYCETCAAIANALWNHRLFLLHGDSQYIDVLERIIHNGFLSGVSLSGDRFFYPNPLASNGGAARQAWFGTSCCPVNVVRFIPSIAGYIYATRGNDLYVNLFVGGTSQIKLGERTVKVSQETRYPWDGAVRMTVDPSQAGEFALLVRIPGWAMARPVPGDLYRHAEPAPAVPVLKVNGQDVPLQLEKGYARIARAWKSGDVVELSMPMPVRRVLSHEKIKDNQGLVALERGPIVYCLEGVDHDGAIRNLIVPDDAAFAPEHRADLLGGVTVLRGKGLALSKAEDGTTSTAPAGIMAVPYYAWCHRGGTEMAVWLPRTADKAKPLSSIRASASHCNPNDTVDALADGIEPKASSDQEIARFTWWDRRGSAEWVQYDFARPRQFKSASVYWFDDTGRGQCRVPASWRLLYRSEGNWVPVEAGSAYGVNKDAWNRVEFKPITTTSLRIEAKLQPTFSGGILEWKAE